MVEMSEENLTARQLYHLAHKDDEDYMARQRELRKASYYRNHEKEKASALARYYKRKEARQAMVVGVVREPAETPDS